MIALKMCTSSYRQERFSFGGVGVEGGNVRSVGIASYGAWKTGRRREIEARLSCDLRAVEIGDC